MFVQRPHTHIRDPENSVDDENRCIIMLSDGLMLKGYFEMLGNNFDQLVSCELLQHSLQTLNNSILPCGDL